MKAIILAGGKGSRLYPVTFGVSKQLLPIYDKPMIYYPLSVLIQARISQILLISTPRDISSYKNLLGDGSKWGISIEYKIQNKPNGLAEAFILGEKFIGDDPVCLILGDNIFHGLNFSKQLQAVVNRTINDKIATIFGYTVKDPERYGVIEFNDKGEPISLEEKPFQPKSNKAIVGLYFYPNNVIHVAKNIKPSNRDELEITSVNNYYLKQKKLHVENLGSGFAWLDTGTHESLLEASQFIQIIEKRQGIKVGCLEELAFENELISKKKLLSQAMLYDGTSYGDYLIKKYN